MDENRSNESLKSFFVCFLNCKPTSRAGLLCLIRKKKSNTYERLDENEEKKRKVNKPLTH